MTEYQVRIIGPWLLSDLVTFLLLHFSVATHIIVICIQWRRIESLRSVWAPEVGGLFLSNYLTFSIDVLFSFFFFVSPRLNVIDDVEMRLVPVFFLFLRPCSWVAQMPARVLMRTLYARKSGHPHVAYTIYIGTRSFRVKNSVTKKLLTYRQPLHITPKCQQKGLITLQRYWDLMYTSNNMTESSIVNLIHIIDTYIKYISSNLDTLYLYVAQKSGMHSSYVALYV